MTLILASTSRYRRELLARLGLPFETAAPAIDEAPHRGEDGSTLALRLACEKARAVVALVPAGAWVLGSDQVLAHGDVLLGKPGDAAGARAMLRRLSGSEARFLTAVALLRAGETGAPRTHLDETTVRFRALNDAAIERYVAAEPAFDCAGSFKSEGLGIVLFEAIESVDPTALIGLPLIATARMLRDVGIDPLQ